MRRSRRCAAALAMVLLTLGGCSGGPGASVGVVPPSSATAPAAPSATLARPDASPSATFARPDASPSAIAEPDPSLSAATRARAERVLAAYAAAAAAGGGATVVPVGELTGQPGNWEEAVGDNNKRALMAGQVFTEAELTPATPASATVAWADGTSVTVPVIGAQDAIVAIEQSAGPAAIPGACDGCTPLIATAARLVQAPFATTRGPATGPVWQFTIRGTAVEVTRVAVANAVVVPRMADEPGGVLAIDAARGSAGGTTLTVTFVGAPGSGDKPCGADYTAQAVESDLAVTVVVTGHRHQDFGGACAAIGAQRSATAVLATPLGDRTVLDLASGQPVTTTRQP